MGKQYDAAPGKSTYTTGFAGKCGYIVSGGVVKTGERIKKLREAQGLSLRALAKEADVSVGYLSKLEQDVSSPTVAMLEKLAEALKVEVSELLVSPSQNAAEEDLPASLRTFLTEQEDNEDLRDPDWIRALKNVRFRGKYPETSEDWMLIYLNLKRAIKY